MIELRPLQLSDASVLSSASQDSAFLKGLLYKQALSIEEAKKDITFILNLEKEGQMIIRSIASDEEVIGRIGARNRDGRWVLFYWIIPGFQSKGHGYDALQEFLTIAPRPLYAEVYEWNTKSANLLLKAGAKKYADVYCISE